MQRKTVSLNNDALLGGKEVISVTIKIERKKKTKTGHFTRLGFTNRLAIYIMLFLAIGLAGGFYLAVRSITYGYTGSLLCWTVVFTPIGTACSVVLSRIVDKSRAENTGADGEGIKYAVAKAQKFANENDITASENSPPI